MIPKSQAEEKRVAANQADVKRIERLLDAAIEHGGAVCVDVGYPCDAVISNIRQKYETGGWKVRVTLGDQRDGVLVELS